MEKGVSFSQLHTWLAYVIRITRLRTRWPRPPPLSALAAQRLARMAALLESLLSQKADINTVLDWLKNVEVGAKCFRAT